MAYKHLHPDQSKFLIYLTRFKYDEIHSHQMAWVNATITDKQYPVEYGNLFNDLKRMFESDYLKWLKNVRMASKLIKEANRIYNQNK